MSRSSLGWQPLRSGVLGVTDAEQGWGVVDEAENPGHQGVQPPPGTLLGTEADTSEPQGVSWSTMIRD